CRMSRVLFAMHIRNEGDGSFNVDCYEGTDQIASFPGSYPFNDASAFVDLVVGEIGGYASSFTGTVHRVGGHQLPDDFDFATWLTTGTTANGARW
ncbi:hypothetical protein, partial [Salipiger aestuarii]